MLEQLSPCLVYRPVFHLVYMSAQVVPRCEVENHSSTLEEEAISVGYTTDIWLSIGTESYITLTAHFTTSDFEQKSYILATKYVRKAYWCDIEECVLQLLSEWNLEKASGTSISMTTDNASNMETAFVGSNWKHIHCVAHTHSTFVRMRFYRSLQYRECWHEVVILFCSLTTVLWPQRS